jgi:predicted adenine nucleotide alpha hydrolase (AANH) superfamily ATPase
LHSVARTKDLSAQAGQMKIFLHTCCAPCLIYPYEQLRSAGHSVTSYFYNPNIHPYREFRKRLKTLKDYCERENVAAIYDEDYGLDLFLREFFENRNKQRCEVCYWLRLGRTASVAAEKGFDAFSTTLLSSPHQDFALIHHVGDALGSMKGIHFFGEDWRAGHTRSLAAARARGLYIQPYCGCVFSEEERYRPKKRRELKKRKSQSQQDR